MGKPILAVRLYGQAVGFEAKPGESLIRLELVLDSRELLGCRALDAFAEHLHEMADAVEEKDEGGRMKDEPDLSRLSPSSELGTERGATTSQSALIRRSTNCSAAA